MFFQENIKFIELDDQALLEKKSNQDLNVIEQILIYI